MSCETSERGSRSGAPEAAAGLIAWSAMVRISVTERQCQGEKGENARSRYWPLLCSSCTLPIPTSPLRTMSKSSLATGRLLIATLVLTEATASAVFASSLDQLTDLTGKAVVTVTLTGRDNFNSEYRYDLTVRNQSSDPLIADSLVVVLE